MDSRRIEILQQESAKWAEEEAAKARAEQDLYAAVVHDTSARIHKLYAKWLGEILKVG